MVSDVTLTGSIQDAQGTQQAGLKLAEDFTQFLTLLTTQLQNQDPLNPMDSTEFTNQLVQFSQVEQAINSNQKLDALVNMNLNSQASTALGYVGLDIRYPSAELYYEGQPETISYVLQEAVPEARLNILDEEGRIVYSERVASDTGRNEYTWDGTMQGGGMAPPGTYAIRIDAANIEGDPVSVSTVVSGRVHGVETQNGVPFLLVGNRAVQIGNVINATVPSLAENASDGTEPPTEGATEEEADS